MYKILKTISLIIRMYLCYVTIDNIPILKNPITNYIFLEVISLYTILRLITYFEVKIFHDEHDLSEFGVIKYFFMYLINLGILYSVMLELTKIGVLPL